MSKVWVQVEKKIKKEDIGYEVRDLVEICNPTDDDKAIIIEDDGWFHPADWCEIDIALAEKLERDGKIFIPRKDDYD